MQAASHDAMNYRQAMEQLLVLYTQVDQLIMEICAERIATAPDTQAKLGLAKQVGDESRHVHIQRDWMRRFGVPPIDLIKAEQRAVIRAHFRELSWLDFLTDLYLCVEALGSEAVDRIVPLADPGTRESLRVPLSDELDHVAFGMACIKAELSKLSKAQRTAYLEAIPGRIDALVRMLHAWGVAVPSLFAAVGAEYDRVCDQLEARRAEMLLELAA